MQQISESLLQHSKQIKATLQDIVTIKTKEVSKSKRTDSKIGGIPYWDDSKPYPYVNNKPAKFMAQINLTDLVDFDLSINLPRTGILQFWYSDTKNNCYYGLNFDGDNTAFCVYHADIQKKFYEPNKQELAILNDYVDFISSQELKMTFKQDSEYLGGRDDYMIEKTYDFYPNLNDDEQESLWDIDTAGSKIGGYAYFTQSDPREQKDDWILLFQLDSDDNFMWGDSGVGNWFINPKDLDNRDFSKVLFNWDCC